MTTRPDTPQSRFFAPAQMGIRARPASALARVSLRTQATGGRSGSAIEQALAVVQSEQVIRTAVNESPIWTDSRVWPR